MNNNVNEEDLKCQQKAEHEYDSLFSDTVEAGMRSLGLGRLGLGTQCLGLGAKRLGLGHLALFNNSVNVRHIHHIFRSNRNVNDGQY